MHKTWFFFVLLFFKNAYINEWNLIFFCFVIFEECIYKCMKFDFLLFCYFWRMHIWMHEIWFSFVLLSLKNAWNFDFIFVLLFLKNAYMNAWNSIFEECMLKCIKFCVFIIFFYFEWKCMFECLIFYFWFSWMIMHILNEWNFIFHFLFSWMIMHEILVFWIIIFDANVCTNFLNDFTNDDFLSELFKDNVSKRYVLIF